MAWWSALYQIVSPHAAPSPLTRSSRPTGEAGDRDATAKSGMRIRDYEIWGLLGEGGMSEVWLAKDEVLSIPVMIKTLGKTSFSVEEAYARVLNEARSMARIPDPRIVRALHAGIHEGTPYVVQEYVDASISRSSTAGAARRSASRSLSGSSATS